MKKLIVAAALGLVTVGAMAQGQFTFANKNANTVPPILAKVTIGSTTDGAAGTAYWAQAYIKLAADPDTSFAPVGAAVNFRTGANAGYIVPVVLSTTYANNTAVTVQMRAWEATGGASYEAAAAALKNVGISNPVGLVVTTAPATPPDMVGLVGFAVNPVPEPSTLALGALGIVGFLLRRRS